MLRHLRHQLHRRLRPERYQHLAQLLRQASLTPTEVLAEQRRAFTAIVRYAAAETPYYRARLGPALAAAGDGPIDPAALPVLRKDDVVRYRDDLLARCVDRERVKLGHTGGSTGRPLAFWYEEAKHERMRAGMYRGFMMSGWRPGQRVLSLWGAERDTRRGGVLSGDLAGWVAGERTLSAVEVSQARLAEWARVVRTWRPVLLYGYASALDALAGYVLAQGRPMPRGLVGVYSTAEVLEEGQRARIAAAFQCKVFNQYGCREVPNIAWECRQGGMHLFADLVHLESLPVDGEDRLLVTSLTDRVMPFIRYELGDSGRLLAGDCPCGSPFPLMEMGVCRQNDLIRTRDGRRVHPSYFNRLLYGLGGGLSGIRQYRWVQRSLERITLEVVAAHPLDVATLRGLAERIRQDVDPGMALDLDYRDQIPRGTTGKHRFVLCELP